MDRKKDPEMRISMEYLLREAEEIDREIAEADMDPMPLEIKERIKGNLMSKIDECEKEHRYAGLSEEDRKALEVGKKMLEKAGGTDQEEKIAYRKKRIRMYYVLAAVLVLVLAMGVTSMGGPERVIEMVKIKVGNRGVTIVNTEEDNYVVVNENEEVVYQELEEVFGVAPVKLTHWPNGTMFVYAEIDEELQTAILEYLYKDKKIHYFISSHYTESSWGVDIEDEVTNQYQVKNLTNQEITIKEYNVEDNYKRYSANYMYNGVEYMLVGDLEKEKFEILVKNLKFF